VRRPYSRSNIDTLLKLFIVAGIAFGIVLRFLHLGRQSLWVDEMLTILNSYIGLPMTASNVFENLQGPMVSAMLHGWGSLGTGDAFLRLPFALVGALTVLAIYRLGRNLLGNSGGLYTAFFASMSPVMLWYSQEVRGYAFALFFAVLMAYYFARWLERPVGRNLVLYGVALFAGLVSHLSVAFLAAAHFFYLILVPSRRRFLGRWIVAMFLVLLIFSPWVRQIIVRVHPEKVVAGDTGAPLLGGADLSALVVPYSFFTYSVGYSLGPSVEDLKLRRSDALAKNYHWIILSALLFGIAAVVGLRRLLQTNPAMTFLLVLWLAVPMIMAIILAARNVRVFNVRYALVSFPAYALVIGQGLSVLSKSRFWLVVPLLACILCISLYNYFESPAYAKDDARSAAHLIEEKIEGGDVVVSAYAGQPLSHYLKDIAEVKTYGLYHVSSPDSMRERSRRLAAGADRIWLSLCREWVIDPEGHIHRWFDENLDLVDSYRFPGLRLYLYNNRRSD
jgi:hypothetical protein